MRSTRKSPPVQIPDIKLTPEGYKKHEEEQKELVEKRPHVLKRMVDAREQGDLSENAGYHAAKEELGRIDSRLRYLKILLRFAKVSISAQKQVVEFGSTVKISSGGGPTLEFKLVSALEADPSQGKMSVNSPIGSALLGKVTGDKIEIEAPDGKVNWEILEIN